MPKQHKLSDALETRSPFTPIVPVDILQSAEKPFAETERKEAPETERKEAPKRTRKISRKNATAIRSALERGKRATTRDSYEAYTDHLQLIEELREAYQQQTGAYLSKSRIIREALEYFLPQALSIYREE